jgi:hypothetical protein
MPEDTHPFPGLRPFKIEEHYLFFGREGQSEEVITRLRKQHFLALIGTSGSGKSSLIRAGLLPYLYGGFMVNAGSSWRIATFRPGKDPIGRLARALNQLEVLGSGQRTREESDRDAILLEIMLRRSGLGLIEAVRRARLPESENLLIIVDQFEELFRFDKAAIPTLQQDDDAAFVKLLLEATDQTEYPIYVVTALRSDFIGDCARFRNLPEAVTSGPYLIPWMTREEQRSAIVEPVKVAGASITSRLVNRLLNDAGENPDRLPILQHALRRTWDYWREHLHDSQPIDLEHYEAVGGMEHALSRHADEAYEELPDERSRRIAKRMFQALTEKGADKRGVRRPVSAGRIADIAGVDPDEVMAVAEYFRRPDRGFLVSRQTGEAKPENDQILDISHESLISGWDRLRKWVDEEADSARIYKRLADRAEEHAKGHADLMRNPDLQKTLEWREANQPNAAWTERYHPAFDLAIKFLEESQAADLERQRKEVEQHKAELTSKTEELRKARKRFWVLAGAFAVVVVALIFAGLMSWKAYKNAKLAEYRENQQIEFAVNAINTFGGIVTQKQNVDQKQDIGSIRSMTKDELMLEVWQDRLQNQKAFRNISESANDLAGDILQVDPHSSLAIRLKAASESYSDHLNLATSDRKNSDDLGALYKESQKHSRDGLEYLQNSNQSYRLPGILLLASSADVLMELGNRDESRNKANLAFSGIRELLQKTGPDKPDDDDWPLLATSVTAIHGVLEGKSRWEFTQMGGGPRNKKTEQQKGPSGEGSAKTGIGTTSETGDNSHEDQQSPTKDKFRALDSMVEIAELKGEEPDNGAQILDEAYMLAEGMDNQQERLEQLIRIYSRIGEIYSGLAVSIPGRLPGHSAKDPHALLTKAEKAYERAEALRSNLTDNQLKGFYKISLLIGQGNLQWQKAKLEVDPRVRTDLLQQGFTDSKNGLDEVRRLLADKNYSYDLSDSIENLGCNLGRDLLASGSRAEAEAEFRNVEAYLPKLFRASSGSSVETRQSNIQSVSDVYSCIYEAYGGQSDYFDSSPADKQLDVEFATHWISKALHDLNERLGDASDDEAALFRSEIANLYGVRSWYDVLDGHFNQAVDDAKNGIKLDGTQVWILGNEAHGYLFQGKSDEASQLYRDNLDKPMDPTKDETLREATIEDFNYFRLTQYPKLKLEYVSRIESIEPKLKKQ